MGNCPYLHPPPDAFVEWIFDCECLPRNRASPVHLFHPSMTLIHLSQLLARPIPFASPPSRPPPDPANNCCHEVLSLPAAAAAATPIGNVLIPRSGQEDLRCFPT